VVGLPHAPCFPVLIVVPLTTDRGQAGKVYSAQFSNVSIARSTPVLAIVKNLF
jgi:hypothetical protein